MRKEKEKGEGEEEREGRREGGKKGETEGERESLKFSHVSKELPWSLFSSLTKKDVNKQNILTVEIKIYTPPPHTETNH